jgi:tRNA threonylcarbamoyladenosine biosynthesis protein TsaB
MAETRLLLGIDTCGPSGSVALAALAGSKLKMLGQTELSGRTYSATLVDAVAALLTRAGMPLCRVNAIVAVVGPGSFTGVRVGLSAVKGLAEPAKTRVAGVSRLEVLAAKADVQSAALDAHRREVFLRLAGKAPKTQELLAGKDDLIQMSPPRGPIGVCDDIAAALLHSAWPDAHLVHVAPPSAMDAIHLALPQVLAGEFVDAALLDGHYLRRSDAEIFGERDEARAQPK